MEKKKFSNLTEKFYSDLEDGELGERVFASYMVKKEGFELIKYNKDIDYDILMSKNGLEVMLEVKCDRYEHFKNVITDNIFIEVRCSNKPSGIMATKANIFVYFFPDQESAYLIKVDKLKELLNTRPDIFRRAEQSGDDGRVIGYLINKKNYGYLFKILYIKKQKCWE